MKSIKKTMLSLLMIAMMPLPVLAESEASSFSTPHWGIRASVDVSVPGDLKVGDLKISLFDSRLGFSVGGYFCAPIANGFYFEPGVALFYDTYGMSDIKIGAQDVAEVDAYVDKFGIRLPIDFGFHFDVWEKASLFVKTGPQLSMGFVAKEHIGDAGDFDEFEGTSNDLYSDEGGFNRLNLLWDVAAGLDFGKVNLSLGYDFGLLNLLKDTNGMASFKENYFRVSIGYSF